jgi:hypothetical protein
MGVWRILPAFILLLLGAQLLVLADPAHAGCPCNMTCPTPRCQCDPSCAVSDFQSYQAANLQIRSVQSSPFFKGTSADIDIGSGFRLIAAPQAFLKLQCQRITEMLSWVSDFQIKASDLQGTLQ